MSICGLADYRRYTSDTTSVDGDITTALTDAQAQFEQKTDRHFESAVYTEICRLYLNGRIYPKAFPITDPGNSPGGVIDGAAIIVGNGYQYLNGLNPFVSGFGAGSTNYQPQITVTYTGGYSPTTMPIDVKKAVAVLAYNMLHVNSLTGVPIGATSVKLGDLAISGSDLSGMDDMTLYVRRTIKRYRKPAVEAFA